MPNFAGEGGNIFLFLFQERNICPFPDVIFAILLAMKKCIYLLILFLCASLLPLSAQKRMKVGVALSGGGAKGAAHIGVLKAIEEAGIPVDYVAGTSMGAVIGGLYAIGYTPDQLDSLIRGQNWEFILSDKPAWKKRTLRERDFSEKYLLSIPLFKTTAPQVSGLIQGQNLRNLLSKLTIGYHDSIDYNRLPIPFACVATNLIDGKEIVFDSGVLATSIRASMSIPGVFAPVKEDSMVLVDGGLVNNYPVDVARQMGADIIIGSTVQKALDETPDITNVADILSQLVTLSTRTKFEDNIKESDLHFQVDTEDFTTMDFKPEVIDSMVCRGWKTVHRQWDELMNLRKRLHISAQDSLKTVPAPTVVTSQTVLPILKVTFRNANRHEVKAVVRKCGIKENTDIKIAQIEDAVRLLQDEFSYPGAYYTLDDAPGTGGKYDLAFHVDRKNESNLYLGLRFDSEEMISAIAGAEFILKTALPSSVFLTGRIGRQYGVHVGYQFEPFLRRNLHVAYEFRRNDMDVYGRGKKQYNLVFRRHTGEVGFTDMAIRNFSYRLGLKVEHYNYNEVLANEAIQIPAFRSDTYFNYFFHLHYNTQDEGYYPSRGVRLQAGYTLYTDNLVRYRGGSPFSAVSASWGMAWSLTQHFTLLPSLCGRIVWGRDIPFVYRNVIGGDYPGRYMPQQLPFAGIGYVQETGKAIGIAGLELRERIGGRHFVSLLGNTALSNSRIDELGSGKFIYGIGLKYGYGSRFGPLEASVGYSDSSKKAVFYVNLGYCF